MRNFVLGILITAIGGLIVVAVNNYVTDGSDLRGAVQIYETRVGIPAEAKQLLIKNISSALEIDPDNFEKQADLQDFIFDNAPTTLQQFLIKNEEEIKSVPIDIRFERFMWAIIIDDSIRIVDIGENLKVNLEPEGEISILAASNGNVIFPARFVAGGRLFVSTDGYHYDSFKMESPYSGAFSINLFVLKNIESIGFALYLIIMILILSMAAIVILLILAVFSQQKGKGSDEEESSD